MPGLKLASIKVMDNLTRTLLMTWRKKRFESRVYLAYLLTEQKGKDYHAALLQSFASFVIGICYRIFLSKMISWEMKTEPRLLNT